MTPELIALGLYALLTLGVGWWSRQRVTSREDYLQASRTLPMAVVLLAYLAANCGALEVVGLSAMAAEYGAVTLHFYWIGAVPAMIFLSLWMMPLYRRNGIQSVPQFLRWRFGPRMQLLNAAVTAVMLQLLAGVSLYALSAVVGEVLNMPLRISVPLCSSAVAGYVLLGGLRATMYNQVLQLTVLVAGLLPLAVRSATRPGALSAAALGAHAHAWRGLPAVNPRAPVDVLGVVVGLGTVLGFSYWCTDFVLMQRAFTARSDSAARQVPLWAAFGKLGFAFLVVVPGLAASTVLHATDGRYDLTVARMMQRMYGPQMLALGFVALCAGLSSAFAANLSGIAAVVTADILPFARSRRGGRGGEYDRAGTATAAKARTGDAKGSVRLGYGMVLLAAAASVILSYLHVLFGNVMEQMQLIFSVLGVPFWAVLLGGLMSRSPSERSAFAGFGAGATVALSTALLGRAHVLQFGSNMAADFYAAMGAFLAAFAVVLLPGRGAPAGQSTGAVLPAGQLDPAPPVRGEGRVPGGPIVLTGRRLVGGGERQWLVALSLLVAVCALVCNWVWR